jgi:hypothetical protein
MPNIVLKNVPQQKNDYDCGIYMLSSIEHLAAAEELPSFETAKGLIAHFSGARLPEQKAIDKKRANFYEGVIELAKAQTKLDIAHSHSDGKEELEGRRTSKQPRGEGPAESPPESASSSAAHGKRQKGPMASKEPASM